MNDELSANLPAELEQLPEATRHHIAMEPALVEAVQENPELLAQLTRGQLAVVQDRLVTRVLNNPDSSIAQLAQVHAALSSNAQLKPAAGASAGGSAQVVINFMIGGKKEPLVIDGQTGNVTPG